KIVFAEADNYKILKAAQIILDEGIAEPILLGRKDTIKALIEEHRLDLGNCKVINPTDEKENRTHFGDILFDKRKRKGLTQYEARRLMKERNYYGAMMVELGQADALISG